MRPSRAVPLQCEICRSTFTRAKGSHTVHCSTACRLFAKVQFTDHCWNWTGSQDGKGYGQMMVGGAGTPTKAHRVAYEELVGSIPEGLQLDHLCRNRLCVNPEHLEPVTNRENCLRGAAPSIVTHLTGVCHRGHSMEDAYGPRKDGSYTCRPCMTERTRRYREAKTNA